MGELMELKVYVDLYLSPNSIMLRFDKQTKRDLRIDSILNGDSIDESMKVMVKYQKQYLRYNSLISSGTTE